MVKNSKESQEVMEWPFGGNSITTARRSHASGSRHWQIPSTSLIAQTLWAPRKLKIYEIVLLLCDWQMWTGQLHACPWPS